MKQRLFLVFLTTVLCSGIVTGQERLRRDQSFLGVHFDFHAGPSDKNIGANTTPQMVGTILDMVHPDYIQVDCKGHPGYSSYPTEVGNPAPGLVTDPLAVWRKVTADRGVGLYMHYSGVWDARAVELHPDWAVKDPSGNPSDRITSVFGPYVDKLLVPQLKELAGKYGVDGLWVDGECWATTLDYGEKAVRLFKEETGFDARTPRRNLIGSSGNSSAGRRTGDTFVTISPPSRASTRNSRYAATGHIPTTCPSLSRLRWIFFQGIIPRETASTPRGWPRDTLPGRECRGT